MPVQTPPVPTSPVQTPPGIDFLALLERPLERVPHKTALIDDGGSASFAEVDARADRLARWFLTLGLEPGERVATVLPNAIAFIVCEIAILRAGLVKVPLNIRFHREEVLYAIADCRPRVLICGPDLAAQIEARRQEVPSLERILVVGGEGGSESYDRLVLEGDGPKVRRPHRPDDPLLLRYTGGTTGRPKGILHTAASFLAIHLDVLRELAIPEEEVALHLGHLSHGLNFMWAAWYAQGATQVLRERFDPLAVWRDIARLKVSYTYMVPTMIQRLLDADDGSHDAASLKRFLYASAPMPVPLLRRALARFGPIFTQVYTLSEAPVITTILHPAEHLEKETRCGPRLGSCGRPVITMALRLLDEEGRPVPDGEVGEIALRSTNNMAAYWDLPEETAETLVEGWVMTGDLARRDEEGFLYLVDRKKDVIITGAFNVYPKEVEAVLYRHPAVAACAVVGVPDPEWGEAIKAFVVVKEGATVTAEDLVALCRAHLADYKKPRCIAFVEALPLSPIGKISRKALRDAGQT